MKPRHIALLLFPLLVALCSAWGPRIIKGPFPGGPISSWPQGPSLVSDFDSRDSNNVTNSGGKTIAWANLVTGSDPATNVLASAPTWQASGGPNNYGYLSFNNDSWLLFHPTNSGGFANTPLTVAVLFSATDTNNCTPFGVNGSGAGPFIIMNEWFDPPNGVAFYRQRQTARVVTGRSIPLNSWFIVVAAMDNLSHLQLFTNGVYAGNYTVDNATVPVADARIGRLSNTYGPMHKGGIAKVVVWKTALSSNECVEASTKIKNDFGL